MGRRTSVLLGDKLPKKWHHAPPRIAVDTAGGQVQSDAAEEVHGFRVVEAGPEVPNRGSPEAPEAALTLLGVPLDVTGAAVLGAASLFALLLGGVLMTRVCKRHSESDGEYDEEVTESGHDESDDVEESEHVRL